MTQTAPLTFGINPFDRCSDQQERFHVVDSDGYIVAKCKYGHIAYDHAGNLSDRNPGKTYTAIDTRDGSIYGAYRNGESVA